MTTAAPPRTFGRSRAVPSEDSATTPHRDGWAAAKATASSIGSGDLWYKIDETKKILCFVDDQPFDWHSAHWLDFIAEGSKSVICWDSLKDENDNPLMPSSCALCKEGDKPNKLSVFFNIISLETPEAPALKVWEVGMMTYKLLEGYAMEAKTRPLNKEGLYFEVSKTKDAKVPKVVPVKGRDLLEDYGFEPLPQDVIAELAKGRKSGPLKEPHPLEKMREFADKI